MSNGFPEVRLGDAITHLMLALIFLLHVDTAQYFLLEEFAVLLSFLLVLSSALIIPYKLLAAYLRMKSS